MLWIALPGLAQTNEGTGIIRMVGDGVFTAEQAARGDTLSQLNCDLCHTVDDWTSPGFLSIWMGNPVSFLFERISTTMPPSNPGQLTADQYVDIIAYLLQLNGAPAGEVPLPGNKLELESILMANSPTD
jgi:hypothetical protein